MVEKLRHTLAQKSAPRSYEESENILLQKITLAMAQLKRAKKELKRLEVSHRSERGDVNVAGDNADKKMFDNTFEPKFRNPDVARKKYEILKLTGEISELDSQLRKLRSFFKPSRTK
ncbi:MAG: hypothetical protein AAB899_00695 [Patescibacteria group bacterium]